MGNPGKMGVGGIIIKNPEQETITFSKSLGKGTINQAEYLAVITALERLSSLKPQSILILSDSQLVINQINGVYHIRDFSFIKPMARI